MMLLRTIVPILLAVAIATVMSVAGASYFIGWPLNATEVEFLLVPSILANSAFEGTTYLTLAEQLRALSGMPWIVSAFQSWGVSPERAQVYIRAFQNLFVCFGVMGLLLALGGRRSAWVALAGFLLFIASGKHHLYYFKIVSSTFVSGLLVLTVAAALARRMWLAGVMLLLVGLVHPAYFVIALAAVLIVYWCSTGKADRGWRPLLPLAVAAPVVLLWLVNVSAILQAAVDRDFWFTYMMLRSDIAFPLRQGYTAVLAIVMPLTVAGVAFWREWRAASDARYAALAGLCALSLLMVTAQILGSEVLRSPTVTRLSLSHRLQFSFDLVIFVSMLWIALRRYMDFGLLSWLALLWFSIVMPTAPLLPQFGLTDRGTVFLAVLAVLTIQDAAERRDRWHFVAAAAAWAVLLGPLTWFRSPTNYAVWVVLGVTVELVIHRYVRVAARAGAALRYAAVAAVLVAAGVIAYKPLPLAAAVEDWKAFSREEMPRLSIDRWQGRLEYADFIRFVTDTVPRDEAILSVPYYLGQSMTPVPYRAAYLDWQESNYVLYVGARLDDVVKRLGTYGVRIAELPEGCTVWAMFLATEGSEDSRCARMSFQRQAWNAKREWRDNIVTIRTLSPRTQWVLLKRTLLCSGEQPVAAWKDLALIRLGDAIPRSGCVPPEA